MTISPTTAERRISAGSSVSAAGQRPPLTPQTSHHYIKEYPIRSQKLQQPILSTNDFNSNSGSHHGSSSLNNSDNRYYNHNKWNVKSSNETLATQTNAETKSKWTIDQAEIASLTSSTKQFPWDAFLLAIILLITGFCLFVVGIIQWFSVKTPEQQVVSFITYYFVHAHALRLNGKNYGLYILYWGRFYSHPDSIMFA